MINNPTTQYKNISRDEVYAFKGSIDILILTATKIETEALHEYLEPVNSQILKGGIDSCTYYIGQLGNYLVMHVQCKAGSSSSSGSGVVTSQAIRICEPKAIIMVGIAFGINNQSQKIGDILVAESIIPYEIKRLGENRDNYRGGNPRASIYLANRFLNHNWEYTFKLRKNGQSLTSKVISGSLLSGEKLIDNLVEREKLKSEFPEAIGGEMEGVGLSSSAEVMKIDWIIIKGICDFADGNKSRNKKIFQRTAAVAAVNYLRSALSEPYIFDELGITQSSISEKEPAQINSVLFRTYNSDSEPYYVIRHIDSQFNNFLTSYSIWLHGISGCGKSTVIMRNLSQSGFEVIQICLASASDYDVNSILNDILIKLRIHFKLYGTKREPLQTDVLIQEISGLIIKYFNFGNHIIYLDEIPEYNDNSVFNAFFQSLYAINVNIARLNPDAKFVFVLSSITSPKRYLHVSQRKILESFKILELENWAESDAVKLITVIDSALALQLNTTDIDRIKSITNGSPRDIKRVFRDYVSTKDLPTYSLERILNEIEQENK